MSDTVLWVGWRVKQRTSGRKRCHTEGHSVVNPAREVGRGGKSYSQTENCRRDEVASCQLSEGKGLCLRERSVCLGSVHHRPPFGPRGTLPPPWTEFSTDACEKITFPQLLFRTVICALKITEFYQI